MISKDVWDYMSVVARSKGAKKVENRRKDLIKTIGSARTKIRNMGGWEKDFALRDSLISYLNIAYVIMKEDYAEIVDMEEIAEDLRENR